MKKLPKKNEKVFVKATEEFPIQLATVLGYEDDSGNLVRKNPIDPEGPIWIRYEEGEATGDESGYLVSLEELE